MMHLNRNGVYEQVRYYRQQPEHMKHAPFDFELSDEQRRGAILDMAVFITVVCLVGLFVWVYV